MKQSEERRQRMLGNTLYLGHKKSPEAIERSRKALSVPIGTRSIRRFRGIKYWWIKVASTDWRAEHRHIMEQRLERRLLSTEIVHHINQDTLDNRLENLQLMTRSEHSKHHSYLR